MYEQLFHLFSSKRNCRQGQGCFRLSICQVVTIGDWSRGRAVGSVRTLLTLH